MTGVLHLDMNTNASMNRRTFIAASKGWLDPLRDDLATLGNEVVLVELEPGEDLPETVLRTAELLVLEVPDGSPTGMRRVDRFRQANPDTPVIAALETADLGTMRALLRHEIHHVVALPFQFDELLSQLVETGASHTPTTPLAPIISFTGAGGNTGSTSFLMHLGAALVAQTEDPVRCCVIDLDLQFGDVAQYGGVEAAGSVASLLDAGKRLDADMLRDLMTPVSDGLFALVAPAEMLPMDDIDIDQLLRIITLARREYDYVLVDLPTAWTNWSLSIAAASDEIFVVTRQNLACLRHAHRCFRMFEDIGLERGKAKLVINHVTRSLLGSISTKDVEQVLNRKATGWLPRDNGDLDAAIDQGRLLTVTSPRSSYVKRVAQIAADLADRLEGDER